MKVFLSFLFVLGVITLISFGLVTNNYSFTLITVSGALIFAGLVIEIFSKGGSFESPWEFLLVSSSGIISCITFILLYLEKIVFVPVSGVLNWIEIFFAFLSIFSAMFIISFMIINIMGGAIFIFFGFSYIWSFLKKVKLFKKEAQ